jgi:hypothetical protein
VTRPMDFRDVLHLAMTCTASKAAVAQGPLHLVSDIERSISHTDIARLLKMLQWCGNAVRTLRLDQKPSFLWAPDLEGVERQAVWEHTMSTMPHPASETLLAIVKHCSRLEELSMHDWVAYNADDPRWDINLISALRQLPELRRVHLPTAASRASMNKRMEIDTVLEYCPGLTQLDLHVSFPLNAARLLSSTHAARLLQLSLHCVAAAEVRRLGVACPHLRRLHLQSCGLANVDLVSALPSSLTALTLLECEGELAAVAPDRVRGHFRHLQLLIFGTHSIEFPMLPPPADRDREHADPTLVLANLLVEDDPRLAPHAAMLDAFITLPSLRVLDVSILDDVDDLLFLNMAHRCPSLHSLFLPWTAVSHVSFDVLRGDPLLLPGLRVLSYRNGSYERNLDDFYTMSLEELAQSCIDDIVEIDEGDWIGYVQPTPKEVRAFYAFCALVVTRGLHVPSYGEPMRVSPLHAHVLCSNYFCIGV